MKENKIVFKRKVSVRADTTYINIPSEIVDILLLKDCDYLKCTIDNKNRLVYWKEEPVENEDIEEEGE